MLIKMETSANGGGSKVKTGTGTTPNANSTEFTIDTGLNSAIKNFILFVPFANASGKYPHACMWSSENSTKYSDSSGSMANLGSNSNARSFMMMSATNGVFVIKTSAYNDVNNSDYVWYAE